MCPVRVTRPAHYNFLYLATRTERADPPTGRTAFRPTALLSRSPISQSHPTTAAVCHHSHCVLSATDKILSQFHPLSLQSQHIIILSFNLLCPDVFTTQLCLIRTPSHVTTPCTCLRCPALRFQTLDAVPSR
jgi:hypothetical protein